MRRFSLTLEQRKDTGKKKKSKQERRLKRKVIEDHGLYYIGDVVECIAINRKHRLNSKET